MEQVFSSVLLETVLQPQAYSPLRMGDGYQNDAICTQPVLETTSKRRRLLSPIGDETLSQRPPSILPEDLIVEILLRLPASSLLQFRRVCKSWETLISDPQFAKKHLRCSTANPSMTHQRLVSPVITEHYNVIHIIVSCPVKPLFENPSTTAKAVRFRMRNEYSIFGSCNGLICLYDRFKGHVRLWNPSTRSISKRSPTVFADGGVITYNGFGYDQVNDKYKVMTVTDDFNEPVTKVYTFGANSWTTIQNLPCCTLATTRWFGIFVSGTLNWVTKGGGSSDQWVISSFDLVKESYGQVLLPQQDGDNICNPVLDVLSNCICLCFYSNKTPHWDVWLMKEYGVVESWTKLMMIPHEDFWSSGWLASFEPLCISENGVVLMKSFYHSKLVLYDSKNVKLDYPKISSKLGVDQHIYHESLISPPLW